MQQVCQCSSDKTTQGHLGKKVSTMQCKATWQDAVNTTSSVYLAIVKMNGKVNVCDYYKFLVGLALYGMRSPCAWLVFSKMPLQHFAAPGQNAPGFRDSCDKSDIRMRHTHTPLFTHKSYSPLFMIMPLHLYEFPGIDHNEPCGTGMCSHTLYTVVGKWGVVDYVCKAPPEATCWRYWAWGGLTGLTDPVSEALPSSD